MIKNSIWSINSFVDKEWDDAMKSEETPIYYRCKMLNGGECIKMYKPSLASVVLKRGAYLKMTPLH